VSGTALIYNKIMEVKMKTKSKKISGIDLILNSANKENKSMPHVSSGTGAHKSIKDYSRKIKHKKNWF